MNTERAATPPLDQYPVSHEFNNYTKKSRHGHSKDVVDENDVRQVAGCVPIDIQNGRVLLISSRKNKDAWVLPKGGWEQDETQQHAAQRETWEEAGIKGTIVKQLGVFEELTNKKRRLKAHHWIFEMHIEEVVKKFPERKKRERRWFTLHEALIATKTHRYIQEALLKSSLNPDVVKATKEAEISLIQEAPPSPRGSISDVETEKQLHEECSELEKPSLLNSIWPILG
ncbi:hypothetical protein CU098_005721 [Rhizopus stolonifer]|uniref:Nudix hydrolase domain-containing protein n=1 Tax=Rhizopus stolonifer TaxID=4846 RepID=A0A367INR7_RHIST|nr:hypothetical protein CU098_005721 [Rhizopus stolonifer]